MFQPFMVIADFCLSMQGLYTVVWIFARGCVVSPLSGGIQISVYPQTEII
jgi:hypothetical protein